MEEEKITKLELSSDELWMLLWELIMPQAFVLHVDVDSINIDDVAPPIV